LEVKDPSRLSNHIEVNGRWFNIDDKRIAGMVKERKTEFRRLRKHFNVKDEVKKDIEDKSHILKVHKEESKFTKEQLQEKAEKMGFEKFRKWANKKFKVTGRSTNGIIKDILSGKKEL
ncbi:hypothetical protein LCGC14_2974560, partial [marine sediment metagenome]